MQTIATFSPAQEVNLLNYQTSALSLGTATIPNVSALDSERDGRRLRRKFQYRLGRRSGSGIKARVNVDAQAGQSYVFLIDFNPAESIVSAGNSDQ